MADQSTTEVGQGSAQETYRFDERGFDFDTNNYTGLRSGLSRIHSGRGWSDEQKYRAEREEKKRWLQSCNGVVSKRWAEDEHAIMIDLLDHKVRVPSSWLNVVVEHPNLDIAVLAGENRPSSRSQQDVLRRRLEDRARERGESLVDGASMRKWQRIRELQGPLLHEFKTSVSEVEAGRL